MLKRHIAFSSDQTTDVLRVESVGPDCQRLDFLVTISTAAGERVHWSLLPIEYLDIYSPDPHQTPDSIDTWLNRIGYSRIGLSNTGDQLRTTSLPSLSGASLFYENETMRIRYMENDAWPGVCTYLDDEAYESIRTTNAPLVCHLSDPEFTSCYWYNAETRPQRSGVIRLLLTPRGLTHVHDCVRNAGWHSARHSAKR